jgi:hypothetical protein
MWGVEVKLNAFRISELIESGRLHAAAALRPVVKKTK